ncbi:sortase-associated OmpA-like protein PdsO [Glaciecola sp. 1036]|uniref:sortase-associated OmpA-like protein PdsO n=1 Tax=Alteromonadaceae TaxID=72275 RepID=UPI003D01B32F
MKKLILATTIVMTLGAGFSSYAEASTNSNRSEKENKNDAIGFGAGAITGAAIGGPAGAVIGGMIGLFIADDVNDENKIEQQEQALLANQALVKQQRQDIAMLRTDIKNLNDEKMTQAVNFETAKSTLLAESIPNIETSVQFKTASATIDESYKNQLDSIAELLVQFPELSARVTGYADHRGNRQFNDELSNKRALTVKQYLMSQQVSEQQIHSAGLGEVSSNGAQPTSYEKLFFDRKAIIKIVPTKTVMTAAN